MDTGHESSISKEVCEESTGKVWFVCQRSTNCCRWPGQVKLTESDIAKIAAFLGMAETDFIEKHTRLQISRKGLALLEKPNGECAFLSDRDCAIQEAKPEQCKGFPNQWNFPGWRQVCKAVPTAIEPESVR